MSTNALIEKRCLTWSELARLYDDANGYQEARARPSGTIMAWALKQKKRFLVNDDGVHLLVQTPKRNVPYPEFCRHPDKCEGKSYCPRDPCCCD